MRRIALARSGLSQGMHQHPDNTGNLPGQEGRDCISDLRVLLCPVSRKIVVVRKCLQASSFPDGQTPTLCRIMMNEVMPILGYMGNHR